MQAINKEVAGNTVLNGGKNKTEVAVETTLEGDIVDRAIESIQRKSERIKKLLVTLTPLLLIITGGSLDALGIIELTGDEPDDDDPLRPNMGYGLGVALLGMLTIMTLWLQKTTALVIGRWPRRDLGLHGTQTLIISIPMPTATTALVIMNPTHVRTCK